MISQLANAVALLGNVPVALGFAQAHAYRLPQAGLRMKNAGGLNKGTAAEPSIASAGRA